MAKACQLCKKQFEEANLEECPDDGGLLVHPVTDPLLGQIINERFEIELLIGRGGMGSVYKARHLAMGRDVAIKFLHPHQTTLPQSIRRFQQEAKAASVLSHPNIVTIHDFGTSPSGEPYLVMDYIEGTDLATHLQQASAMPWKEAVELLIQICDGLAHAHEQGVVHRDIKPSNIMLIEQPNKGRTAKLFDFGIAKLLSEDDSVQKLTQTGELFGSPLYMSPEQCRGLPANNRSDLYSLGCVFYEMLASSAPLHGVNALETMNMHISQTVPSILPGRPELPNELDSVLSRLLAKNPNDRFPSANDLKFDLQMLLHGDNQQQLLPISKKISTTPMHWYRRVGRPQLNALKMAAAMVPLILLGCILLSFHAALPALFIQLAIVLAGSASVVCILSMLAFGFSADDIYRPNQLLPKQLRSINQALAKNLGDNPADRGGFLLGWYGEKNGMQKPLGLSSFMRQHNPHIVLAGMRGSGKTRMLAGAISHDIHNKAGATIVIDRTGDLTDLVTGSMAQAQKFEYEAPAEKLSVVIDPSTNADGIAFDPLRFTDLDIASRAQAVVDAFKSVHSQGPQTHRWTEKTSLILGKIVVLLCLTNRSLLDLVPILTDSQLREELQCALHGHEPEWTDNDIYLHLQRSSSTEEWMNLVSPILDIAMPAFTHPHGRALLTGTTNINLTNILQGNGVLFLHIADIPEAGLHIFATLAIVLTKKSAESIYAYGRALNPCTIFVDDFRNVIDSTLFDQISARRNVHLKLGFIGTTPTLERLPIALRDLLFDRIGVLCAFRMARPDAQVAARYLVPAEAIYTASTTTIYQGIGRLVERLVNQESGYHITWIREATAGIFQLKAPNFSDSGPKRIERS